MGVKHIEAFSDSLLVVQQVDIIYQCFKVIALNDFTVQHVSLDENIVVNDLAQQASGF
jgi:hypothetical protein